MEQVLRVSEALKSFRVGLGHFNCDYRRSGLANSLTADICSKLALVPSARRRSSSIITVFHVLRTWTRQLRLVAIGLFTDRYSRIRILIFLLIACGITQRISYNTRYFSGRFNSQLWALDCYGVALCMLTENLHRKLWCYCCCFGSLRRVRFTFIRYYFRVLKRCSRA